MCSLWGLVDFELGVVSSLVKSQTHPRRRDVTSEGCWNVWMGSEQWRRMLWPCVPRRGGVVRGEGKMLQSTFCAKMHCHCTYVGLFGMFIMRLYLLISIDLNGEPLCAGLQLRWPTADTTTTDHFSRWRRWVHTPRCCSGDDTPKDFCFECIS